MFKKNILLFGCIVLSFLCKGQPSKVSTTNISSLNKTLSSVTFIIVDSSVLKDGIVRNFVYQDSLYYGHPVFLNDLETKLLLNAPTFLWQGDDYKTLYLIYPGEKIKIKKGENKTLIFLIEGNAERTNELAFFRKLIQKFGTIYNYMPTLPYHFTTTNLQSVHGFEKAIYDTKCLRLKFLDSFSKSSPVSNAYFKIAVNTIESAALKDTLLLYWSNKKLLESENLYQPLIEKKIIALSNINYQPYLIYFNTCISLVSLSTSNFVNYKIANSNDFIKHYQFIDSTFKGLTRDFLLANTLYTAFKSSIEIPKNYIEKFYSECKDQGYKKIITNKLNEKQSISYAKGSDELLSGDGKTIEDIKVVLSHYKGKLILLDFWASWCSPCRAEMPFSEKLKKEYLKKDISFIYISTDESKDNWSKAQQEENLDSNSSFLLLNGNISIFAKQNLIQAIPHYMLIGRNGKVISHDAPRPSDPLLKILIDKNLKNLH